MACPTLIRSTRLPAAAARPRSALSGQRCGKRENGCRSARDHRTTLQTALRYLASDCGSVSWYVPHQDFGVKLTMGLGDQYDMPVFGS